jgi:hypothetical protein
MTFAVLHESAAGHCSLLALLQPSCDCNYTEVYFLFIKYVDICASGQDLTQPFENIAFM